MTAPSKNVAWGIPVHASKVQDLTKITKEIPNPGPKQVLIKLTAASLNFRDWLIATRSPYYPGTHKADLIPGSDGVGIIQSVGPSSSWAGKEGMLVNIHCGSWLTGDVRNLRGDQILGGSELDGSLQSYQVVDDGWVIPSPKNLNAEEASSLFTAGATAWAAIRGGLDARLDGVVEEWKGSWTDKRLKGKWVLTQGTGGVSCFAIQIAYALGATVIATSSSDEKLKTAKALGAAHVINYKTTPDWDQEILHITSGKGVDHVVEVGGAQTIMKSLNSVRPGGLVSVIGILSDSAPIAPEFIPTVLFGAKIVKGCTAFSRDTSAEFVKFVEANEIKPVIAQIFDFDHVVEAFERLEKQNAIGKLVVKISD